MCLCDVVHPYPPVCAGQQLLLAKSVSVLCDKGWARGGLLDAGWLRKRGRLRGIHPQKGGATGSVKSPRPRRRPRRARGARLVRNTLPEPGAPNGTRAGNTGTPPCRRALLPPREKRCIPLSKRRQLDRRPSKAKDTRCFRSSRARPLQAPMAHQKSPQIPVMLQVSRVVSSAYCRAFGFCTDCRASSFAL